MADRLAADMATARTLVTLAVHDDDTFEAEVDRVAADPTLAAGALGLLAVALAATFDSPEDWQRHLAGVDAGDGDD